MSYMQNSISQEDIMATPVILALYRIQVIDPNRLVRNFERRGVEKTSLESGFDTKQLFLFGHSSEQKIAIVPEDQLEWRTSPWASHAFVRVALHTRP
jgi:hypothetical protein